METSEIREQLSVVDRVLAQADQTVCVGADIFLVWGLASALLDIVFQLRVDGRVGDSAFIVPALGIAIAIVYSIVRGRSLALRSERKSNLQREFLNVLWITMGVTAIADMAAFRIFDGWSAAAIWTMASAVVTLYIGMHGNRRAIVGAIILIASLIVANFTPQFPGYVLAAGMLVGYSGFGLATMLARD